VINPTTFPGLKGGDTLVIPAGTYSHLTFRELRGTSTDPIVVINQGNVLVESGSADGIRLESCAYLILSGAGYDSTAGFFTVQDQPGNGIVANRGSSYIRIEHMRVSDVAGNGIEIRTQATCDGFQGDTLTLFRLGVRECTITHTGEAGISIGSQTYGAWQTTCNGNPVWFLNPFISIATIRANQIEHTGSSAIELFSGSSLDVSENRILQFGETEPAVGIRLGTGTSGNVLNNRVFSGNGTGISCEGIGGARVCNNVVVKGGEASLQTGIQLADSRSQSASESNYVLNNLIRGADQGIWVEHTGNVSVQTTVANNVVVNPMPHTQDTLVSSDYLSIRSGNVTQEHNLFAPNWDDTWFIDWEGEDWTPRFGSELVDAGANYLLPFFRKDLNNEDRIRGYQTDLGPVESPYFSSGIGEGNRTGIFFTYTNPARNGWLQLQVNARNERSSVLYITSMNGQVLLEKELSLQENINHLEIPIQRLLPSGSYIITLQTDDEWTSGPLIVQD